MKKISLLLLLTAIVVSVIAQKKLKPTRWAEGIVYLNKDYSPRSYNKILIVTPSHDLDMHAKLQKEFAELGIVTMTGMELLPPVKEYSDADIKEICDKNGIDGILKLELKSKSTQPGGGREGGIGTLYKFSFQAALQDLKTALVGATFIGTASSTDDLKAIPRFVNLLMPEVKPLLNH